LFRNKDPPRLRLRRIEYETEREQRRAASCQHNRARHRWLLCARRDGHAAAALPTRLV